MIKSQDPSGMMQEDYVIKRFFGMPKEMVDYLDLEFNVDTRAHLEVLFRSEYYRYRHDIVSGIAKKAYAKLMAAKMSIGVKMESCTVEQVDAEIDRNLGFVGEIEEIPQDF